MADEQIQTRFLHRRLEALDGQLAMARKRLHSGTPEAQVDARGDMAVLERRRAALAERLAEIEAEAGGSGAIDRVQGEFAQDVAILEDDLKRWMDGLDAARSPDRTGRKP